MANVHAALRRISVILMLMVHLGFLAACDQASPVGPAMPLDQQFIARPGQPVSIAGAAVRVQFVEVINDSRCPLNATCITAGDATIAILVVDDQGSSRYELHTDPSRKSATHRDLRIELMELQPYPDTTRPTDPAQYRVTLRASRK
jgi:hypothetical protein